MLGNGVVGILAESVNKWERRAPLTPSHCARLLHGRTGVSRIIVQPSTKRIHHDALYEEVGAEISEDLSQCGLILGIKQPKLEMILPDRAYAFFSHTHKAQKENMPLLDKILAERASLFDYELIVGDNGKRLLAFGKFAGRVGMIDFLRGLGQRFLSLGYSTPFLSLGSSYMYPSLAAAKAAVISVGEEIATQGLPLGICPLVFVFTGSGNVCSGAKEIFRLLPHTFVDPSRLSDLHRKDANQPRHASKRVFQVYGCVVTAQDMVEPKDPMKVFDKADYYAHPEHYNPTFHEKIAPYASVIVNCMYWEKRFPQLLSYKQMQDLMGQGCPLVGIADITCDIGGSLEFVNHTTSIDSPFFRYDPITNSYHDDMDGDGVICLAVDILPTEFAKEASQHFGNILSQFVVNLALATDITKLPAHLKRACIVHRGVLTSLYDYIPRMRHSDSEEASENSENSLSNQRKYNISVSLSGHLFDQFLINEALDIIEAAGGTFHLVNCHVGQSVKAVSFSELEVGADDRAVLDQIIDSLTAIAKAPENDRFSNQDSSKISLKLGKVEENGTEKGLGSKRKAAVLILGAGRVCQPAAEMLSSFGRPSSSEWYKTLLEDDFECQPDVEVIVGSLYLKDVEQIAEGIPNVTGIQLDVTDHESLCKYISQVDVVISLLFPSYHIIVANACIELKKHLVTASYVDSSMSMLDDKAKDAGITILGEMGLDPGIDHMMAMKMINQAHSRKGKIKSFTSYCGGLPSPEAANNPLAYKFSWNPAGAIRAGRNPATYKWGGEIVHIDGNDLYDSATRLRLPELPAFSLECLPNRNSLLYGDLYGIASEASTIFRGTLRYEGFSEIMGTLSRIGLFNDEAHSLLTDEQRPTFRKFLFELLKVVSADLDGPLIGENDIMERILACYTDASNQAQCGSGGATTEAAGGYWQYHTTTYVETVGLLTKTEVYSTYVPAVATQTCSQSQNPCGSTCCDSGFYCLSSSAGTCALIAGGSSGGISPSAPLRPTSSGVVVITYTGTPTATVPFQTPIPTGAAGGGLVPTEESNSGLSGGAIAGIVIGVILGILLLLLLCLFCCARALFDTLLAIFGIGKKRKHTHEETYIEEHHHSGGAAAGGRWYGAGRPSRPSRAGSEKHSGAKKGLGLAAGLGGLALALGLKRRHDAKVDDKSTTVSGTSYMYSDYTSSSSASSSDRHTRRTRHSSRR